MTIIEIDTHGKIVFTDLSAGDILDMIPKMPGPHAEARPPYQEPVK